MKWKKLAEKLVEKAGQDEFVVERLIHDPEKKKAGEGFSPAFGFSGLAQMKSGASTSVMVESNLINT